MEEMVDIDGKSPIRSDREEFSLANWIETSDLAVTTEWISLMTEVH